MTLSPVGLPIDALDTPALLLDLDAFERNARSMAATIAAGGKRWRPHAKALKSPALAHALFRAGARGLTVAKVSEAEVFAAAGVVDILIAHLVVGPSKAARLAALQRTATVLATVDHADHLPPLAEAARAAGTTIGLLVDVDIGLHRTGVAGPTEAVALAGRVADTPGLRLEGLMGYEGHALLIADPAEKRAAIEAAYARLVAARDALRAAGLACPIVSAGGSGSFQVAATLDGPTELQAGGAVFGCMYYTQACRVAAIEPALSVLSTVVGRPSADRAVLDAGRKAISDHKADPIVADHPTAQVVGLSAEHAMLALASADAGLAIGRKLQIIPGYSDLTTVLHDRLLVTRSGRVEATWELTTRGCLQ